MTTKTTTFEITVFVNGESHEITLNDHDCAQDIINLINDKVAPQRAIDESDEDEKEFEIEDMDVEDWGEVPERFQNWDNVFAFVDVAQSFDYDFDVLEAADKAGIDIDSVADIYEGYFGSDEDFAENMAEQTGAVDKDAKWPMNCIDWTYAAKELMYDYTESDGHYFRNI